MSPQFQFSGLLIRRLRSAEAGVLANRPVTGAIHRGLNATRERVLPGKAEVALVVQLANVLGRVKPVGLEAGQRLESLAALGFAVGSTRGVVRVEKYGCGAEFRKGTDERYQMTIPPTIMLKGKFTRLWDAGYQKFLLTDEGLKLPALATHLQNLRKFNEELRTALGIPTFYNEALGSVSQVSVYDRVKGRKGAVPDETVGAHSTAGRR